MKITFKRQGYLLIAEAPETDRTVRIAERLGRFELTPFIGINLLETTWVNTLNEAKETARQFIRND